MEPPIAPPRAAPRRPAPPVAAEVAAVVALCAVVLAATLHAWPRPPAPATGARALAPTATPITGPPVTAAQAWGASAGVTVGSRVDATHYLPFAALAPDGRTLAGYEVTVSGGAISQTIPAEAGLLDAATGRFTAIAVSSLPKCVGDSCAYTPPVFPLNCCQTDGRFFIAQNADLPGGSFWSYDRQTGSLWQLSSADYGGIENVQVDHGQMVFSSGAGVYVADLAARALAALPGTSGKSQLVAYAWPYVLYETPQTSITTGVGQLEAFDVVSHARAPLTAVPAAGYSVLAVAGDALVYAVAQQSASSAGGGEATLYVLDPLLAPDARPRAIGTYPAPITAAAVGDILFFSTLTGLPAPTGPGGGFCPAGCRPLPTPTPAPPPITTLYAVEHFTGPDPRPGVVAAYRDNLGGIVGATDRLVVLGRAAWDRAEGRFVAFQSLAGPAGQFVPWARLIGHYVTITRPLTSDWLPPVQVTIYDTTRLAVLRGA